MALVNLNSYQNVKENAVLYWTMDPIDSDLLSYVWEIQTDLVDTFSSLDLRTYYSTDSKIVIDSPLVTGNTISVKVDGDTVATLYATSSYDTLVAFAEEISLKPGATAYVVGTNKIVVTTGNPAAPVILSDPSITGGTSQANISIGLSVDSIPGRVHQGMVVPIYDRLQGAEQTMYWRVRGLYYVVWTDWSAASIFTIAQAIDEVVRDADLALLPEVVYKKDVGSNINGVHWTYGQAIDDHWMADVFANNDLSTSLVRDASVEGKFGPYISEVRPQAMKMIDYREILKAFLIQARNSPVYKAIRLIIRAMLGLDPTYTTVLSTLDFYVSDGTSTPVVEAFYVSDEGTDPVSWPTLWDDIHLSRGIIVNVTNPVDAIVSTRFAESITRKLIPADVPLYVVGLA